MRVSLRKTYALSFSAGKSAMARIVELILRADETCGRRLVLLLFLGLAARRRLDDAIFAVLVCSESIVEVMRLERIRMRRIEEQTGLVQKTGTSSKNREREHSGWGPCGSGASE